MSILPKILQSFPTLLINAYNMKLSFNYILFINALQGKKREFLNSVIDWTFY